MYFGFQHNSFLSLLEQLQAFPATEDHALTGQNDSIFPAPVVQLSEPGLQLLQLQHD